MRHKDDFQHGRLAKKPGKDDKHNHDHGTSFSNPWPSAKPTWQQSLEIKSPFELVTDHHHQAKEVEVVAVNFERDLADESQIHAIWLGHAGFLVQLPRAEGTSRPIRLLFDPMFSTRASPVRFAGPARRLKKPCEIEDLPEVDFVFTSHSHYDHLDHHTITHALKSCAQNALFCVPLGVADWMADCKILPERIIELDWWETRSISLSALLESKQPASEHLRIAFVPAQHGSGRSLNDQGSTLWGGWVVEQVYEGKRASIYHAGDTGYRAHPTGAVCPAFAEIGERLGPFDLSFVPIWRGASLSFLSYLGVRLSPEAFTQAHHCTPADALALHRDVKSKHTLAMHFATFAGSDDEATWPIDLLKRAQHAEGTPETYDEEGGFGYINVGAVASVYPSHRTADEVRRDVEGDEKEVQSETSSKHGSVS